MKEESSMLGEKTAKRGKCKNDSLFKKKKKNSYRDFVDRVKGPEGYYKQ